MTRKDYVAIARAIKSAGDMTSNGSNVKTAKATVAQVARAIAAELAADNAASNRGRFMEACGVQEG